MPSDSNGVYSLPPQYFVQNGDTVLPVQHNPPFLDVAAGLTNRIMKDGRTVMTGDLKMGGFKVTGMEDGANPGDAVTKSQLDTTNASLDALTEAVEGLGTIASAATMDIGAEAEGTLQVTGTTTVTSLDTADAGVRRRLIFADALTLTHNATSLILQDGVDAATAAGDMFAFVSEGSGNWREIGRHRASTVNTRSDNKQAWELIETRTVTAQSPVDFTDLDDYVMLSIKGHLLPNTNDITLRFRTSTDNGDNWDEGASDYTFQYLRGSVVVADAGGATDNHGLISALVGGSSAGTYPITIDTRIYAFNKSVIMSAVSQCGTISSAGQRGISDVMSTRNNAAARNAVRIYPTSGQVSGLLILEGIRG